MGNFFKKNLNIDNSYKRANDHDTSKLDVYSFDPVPQKELESVKRHLVDHGFEIRYVQNNNDRNYTLSASGTQDQRRSLGTSYYNVFKMGTVTVSRN